MKTLTALVMLVGLTASAQTPAMHGASVDFETLMGMHSMGEKTVMQAFNGGACQVTPISDLPVRKIRLVDIAGDEVGGQL